MHLEANEEIYSYSLWGKYSLAYLRLVYVLVH